MPDPREVQDKLLKEYGAILTRQRKHEVWKLPDGRVYVRASTPSNAHSDDNALRALKAVLGMQAPRGMAGERRERVARRKLPLMRAELGAPFWSRTLQDELRKVS